MKAIICHDADATALIDKLALKEHEMLDRFAMQSQEQRQVAADTMRGAFFVVIEWLQAQGFTVRR